MAAAGRTPDTPVVRALLTEGRRFEFFQAVRLLERLRPGSVRVGYQGPAEREGLRLRPSASLGFPAADLESVEERPDGRFGVTATFLGLYGASSPLPAFYAEEILWQEGTEAPTRDFLDLFHHRLLSLFYRCWTKYRYYVRFAAGGGDEISGHLLALVGLATRSLRDGCPVPPLRLLRYVGLITQRPHNAVSLEAMLSSWFGGLPVAVRQFEPRWVRLPPSRRNAAGVRSATLGTDLVVGARVLDRTGKFRVVVGPVGWERFLRFLPDGEDFAVLVALVRLFVTDPLEFDIEVRLKGEEVPPLRLGGSRPFRMGWTTWAPAGRMEDQAVVFRVPEPGTDERRAAS